MFYASTHHSSHPDSQPSESVVMAIFTVGDYLAQLHIQRHFFVPGDYNLILLNKLEGNPALHEIGCTNEPKYVIVADRISLNTA